MSEPVTGATAPGVLPAVAPARFRSLMAAFPAGVAVVTTAEPDGRLCGLTCTALCSVSDQPATLLVCMQQSSRTLESLRRTETFALNLLHERARPVAEMFASRAADCFTKVPWKREPRFGAPHLVEAAHTIADCRVTEKVVVGDHTVVFGEVFGVTTPADQPLTPLLYGLRSYWSLDQRHDAVGAADSTQQCQPTQ